MILTRMTVEILIIIRARAITILLTFVVILRLTAMTVALAITFNITVINQCNANFDY